MILVSPHLAPDTLLQYFHGLWVGEAFLTEAANVVNSNAKYDSMVPVDIKEFFGVGQCDLNE